MSSVLAAQLLSGNEAIARGAYEAGCLLGAGYPGTPSTEIIENLRQYPGVYTEWSANEKVAMEVAMGAALAGARALVTMKHVGFNVGLDPFMTFAYMHVTGALVVVTADDPGMHSSQNEQDNRNFGRMARVPVLEPSDSQEAKDFVAVAFDLAEQFGTPVILRTTTRVAHARSPVHLGERPAETVLRQRLGFQRQPELYVMLPAHARRLHPAVEQRLDQLREWAESTPLNRVEWRSRSLGFITGGAAYLYVREAFPGASVLKLGAAYPLPEGTIRAFAAGVEQLYVVEEGDPFWELEIRAMGVDVRGKGVFPRTGELSPAVVAQAVRASAATPAVQAAFRSGEGAAAHGAAGPSRGPTSDAAPVPVATGRPAPEVPPRPPVLCPGCPHRGVFYVLRKLHLTVAGDIGCYTLGALPPLAAMDTCTCMGSSITHALGMEKALGPEQARKIVAVIGDSTFIHSGITGLIDAVYNRGRTTVVILDNGTTAMTGHQGNPASGLDVHDQPAPQVDLEQMARACGVGRVRTVDAYDLAAVEKAVREALEAPEPAVVVARRACALLERGPKPKLELDPELCRDCGVCLRSGCPALEAQGPTGRRPKVNEVLCTGCGVCAQLCHFGALRIAAGEPVAAPTGGGPARGAPAGQARFADLGAHEAPSPQAVVTFSGPAPANGVLRDFVIAGVGGQGGLLATRLLAQLFLDQGWQVKTSEVHGMAQRGGSVESHVRRGQEVLSPLISPGQADVLLALEKAEALRYLYYLRPGGLLLVNDEEIPPLAVAAGQACYPGDADLRRAFGASAGRFVLVPGLALALRLGNAKMANVVMLGALSNWLEIEPAVWERVLRQYLPVRIAEANLQAFHAGRASVPRLAVPAAE
ncbi:MAG: indolepyruvate ferredoxin oxidoreductase subunit alpha [Firmicutes bacterium]|nr:indolepyruvate ferredoxin oxidoreductase subunit alpha [Bacillota bacterium]